MTNHSVNAFRIAAMASLGGFLFGFDATVISGVTGFVSREFDLTDAQIGLLVGIPTLLAVASSLTVGLMSDYLGRRPVLQLLALVYAVSAALSALAQDYNTLLIARAIGGYAFGSLVLAPVYIAELSPPKQRGLMVSVNQLNIVVGFSAAYFANYFILRLSHSGQGWVGDIGLDTNTWNFMLGTELIPAISWLLFMFILPESPRWLAVQGKRDAAREVLARITPPEQVDAALKTILDSIDSEIRELAGRSTGLASRFRELFSADLRLPIIVGLIAAVAQQITGVNAVYFYAPTIFEQSGVGTNAAFVQAVFVGLVNVVFTIVAMVLVDRVGRKPLLLAGLAGVFVSLSVAAWGFHEATYQLDEQAFAALAFAGEINSSVLQPVFGTVYQDDVAFKNAMTDAIGATAFRAHEADFLQTAIAINPWVVLAGILGFVASFAFSLGPVMWILLSEIFPNRIRGLAISFVTVFNSGVSFGVQYLFPWEVNTLGSAMTLLIYGLFAIVGFVLLAWLLPETKGRTLEEMQESFRRKNPL